MKRHRYRRAVAVLLGLGFAAFALPTAADPPGGGDAPGSFAEAAPIAPAIDYSGSFAMVDMDFYKFTVAEGQDITVVCRYYGPALYGMSMPVPCLAQLIDPMGMERASSPPTDPLSFKSDMSGDWRLRISGIGPAMASPYGEYYQFSMNLAGAGSGYGNTGGGGGYGGGAIGLDVLLGVLVLLVVGWAGLARRAAK